MRHQLGTTDHHEEEVEDDDDSSGDERSDFIVTMANGDRLRIRRVSTSPAEKDVPNLIITTSQRGNLTFSKLIYNSEFQLLISLYEHCRKYKINVDVIKNQSFVDGN